MIIEAFINFAFECGRGSIANHQSVQSLTQDLDHGILYYELYVAQKK